MKYSQDTACSVFFINKMFLHCFFQLHVSALAMSHLQVDNIQLAIANCMVCLANKKVINLAVAMSHLQVDHIQLAIANCM